MHQSSERILQQLVTQEDQHNMKTRTEEHHQHDAKQQQLQQQQSETSMAMAMAMATATEPLTKTNETTVYTFHCPAYNATLYAHGIALSQFKYQIALFRIGRGRNGSRGD